MESKSIERLFVGSNDNSPEALYLIGTDLQIDRYLIDKKRFKELVVILTMGKAYDQYRLWEDVTHYAAARSVSKDQALLRIVDILASNAGIQELLANLYDDGELRGKISFAFTMLQLPLEERWLAGQID